MKTATLDPLSLIIVSMLRALDGPLSFSCLVQLTDRGAHAVLQTLRTLENDGCIRQNDDEHWAARSGAPLERVVAQVRQMSEKDAAASPLARALLCSEHGDALGGCEQLLEVMRVQIRDSRSAATLACLDMLIRRLRGWEHAGRPSSELRRYLTLIRRTQAVSMYMAKRIDDALDLLSRARQAAEALGDRRVMLLLDLTEASQQHLTRTHNTEQPRALLARTLQDIHALGDPDILASASHCIGILHFMQSEYATAIDYLRSGTPGLFTRRFDYFEEMRLRYIASAACSLGRFDLAVGVMVAALREARLTGHKLAAKWHQTHLADELLRMGRPEEALEQLDAVLPCCDPETETRLWIWGTRCLAYYHFQHGRIGTSHRIFHDSMDRAVRLGLIRPYYGFTWLFDMLLQYQEHGLAPIPGYDLEDELAAALRSPSRLLAGAALRIRARQQEQRGAPSEVVTDLLRQSLEHAEAVGNPLEIARVRLALSPCLQAQGRTAEAEALYDAGRAVLRRHSQYDCPPPRPGVLLDESEGAYAPPAGDCLARCRAGLEVLPAWTSLEEHLERILETVRDALEVERAALFRPDDGRELACLGACHISQPELDSQDFRIWRERLAACADAPGPIRLPAEHGAALCLPLPVLHGRTCLLFLQSFYTTDHIVFQDPAVFKAVGRMLSQELRTALLVQERLRDTRQAAEERARLAAARLDGTEAPYYGASMRVMLQQADQAAATDAPVLILGETGVGKEMLARRVHARSGRTGPFVPVHPASTPENLFESEFFGHEKGAFTGAHRQKIGLFEVADKGTLFIDEVGDVPPALQTKLLRVLQEKSFLRVGGTREIRSDFRLVTATNRDLGRMVREGTFREDLYYRVAVVPLHLPPLRERPEDVLPLARLFLERFARRYQRRVPSLALRDRRELQVYPWPGNVRELKSVMERTVILHDGGPLRFALTTDAPPPSPGLPAATSAPSPEAWNDLPTLEELQRRYIRHVLQLTRGRVDGEGGALRILGMKRSTLYARIRACGLDAASQLYGPEK